MCIPKMTNFDPKMSDFDPKSLFEMAVFGVKSPKKLLNNSSKMGLELILAIKCCVI